MMIENDHDHDGGGSGVCVMTWGGGLRLARLILEAHGL